VGREQLYEQLFTLQNAVINVLRKAMNDPHNPHLVDVAQMLLSSDAVRTQSINVLSNQYQRLLQTRPIPRQLSSSNNPVVELPDDFEGLIPVASDSSSSEYTPDVQRRSSFLSSGSSGSCQQMSPSTRQPRWSLKDNYFRDISPQEASYAQDLNSVEGRTMNIKVQWLTDERTVIQVRSEDNISRVKRMFCDKEGIEPEHQKLLLSGIELEDRKTLSDYNILDGFTLNLVLLWR
jgi:Ubiquitin family